MQLQVNWLGARSHFDECSQFRELGERVRAAHVQQPAVHHLQADVPLRLAAILPLPAHLLARIVADPRWCALRSSVSLFYALSSTVRDYLLSPHPIIPGFVSSEYSVFFEY